MNASSVPCHPLSLPVDPTLKELHELQAAFAGQPALEFDQAWLSTCEPAFRPAWARTGWREGELLILAELTDDDIYNSARKLNENTWELGDVFEIFLRNTEKKNILNFT